MIFQTRDIMPKDFEIGHYIQIKNMEGKLQLEKQLKEIKDKKAKAKKELTEKKNKTMKTEEKIKLLGMDNFNLEEYI